MENCYTLVLDQPITNQELVQFFKQYVEQMEKTGELAGWENETFAFPYDIEVASSKLLLKGNVERYEELLVLIDHQKIIIQLTPASTFGDKNKASIYSKLLAKKWKAHLVLPNERTMNYS